MRWHAVVIIVSSQATYNQVIGLSCRCILAIGTDIPHKDQAAPAPGPVDPVANCRNPIAWWVTGNWLI